MNISLEDSICVFEKDINNDVLLTWSFPSIDDGIRQVVLNRTSLTQEKISLSFNFSKYKNFWIYIYTSYISAQESHKETFPSNLKRVVAYSICLVRNNFNPEKYGALAQIMSNVYQSTGDCSKLLECHLRVINRGQFDIGPLGKFQESDYDVRRSYLATSIKDIITLFGDEIILIWSAMIMKKRIVVYSEKMSSLLKVIRAFPLLVSHRQNWNILRPYVTMSDLELKDLTTTGIYCAGFTDPSIKSHEDYYDILVDLSSKDVTVSSHAKDQFILGSFHRDMLKYFNAALEDEEINDQDVIKGLVKKTKELLTKLETLKEEKDGKQQITQESLDARKLPNGMAAFIMSIVNAEGLNG
ncbi:FAM45 family protein [Tieghemostelium lacteum]|uniref:FAM45 family protein n=1 Tax=Tieghemostelium lacteum TaxID=361077 RepID=A0A151ZFB5_TIELA|nr:FAM45 family protein [Tieghemostelium lacteum]|eukprot:KYQ92658.1 FAM45 family protein [Tieghemostelium lacteum]